MLIDFFATDTDLLQIARWLLEVPGMTLFEPASRPNFPNRHFLAIEEVAESLQEPGRYIGAWLESTGARPFSCYIELSGRTELRSPSVISIHRYNDQNGALGVTRISCWNEKGAKQRSFYSTDFLDQVRWKALRSIMGKFKRIIGRTSPAKLHSYPIMENAFFELREGRLLLWDFGEPCSYPSPHVTLVQLAANHAGFHKTRARARD